ncbi:hypothetical protein RM697_07065 [Ichthyenterobacterium sp. W332]|uniref:Uncharacterized protein n=1 Tax=Microcosmobacter mediterraneus TaxID=3075607 RepID=A0ABU2YJQ1_9FLAO|nr:hypothetical protein [Ichthyenterobacterium sp. W332]MDT0558399.1 hypothetical protein [Ichthyenterobacterium sp. W332]
MKFLKATVLIYVLSLCVSFTTQAQELNNYKYIIVPNQFEFTKGKDKYQLNSLTKFLFNKNGYTAFLEDEDLPKDLKDNRCLALRAEAKKVKGFLKNKIQIELIDCNRNLIIASKVGETREKEYKKGYNLALRDAFVTFSTLDYKYEPLAITKSVSVTEKEEENSEELEKLKAEVEALKKEKEEVKLIEKLKKEEQELKKKLEEAETAKVEAKTKEAKTSETKSKEILYAQPIDNGFQLVDTTPKKVMILLATPKADVFSVKDKNAIVYKEDGKWYYSEVTTNGNVTKELNIKF